MKKNKLLFSFFLAVIIVVLVVVAVSVYNFTGGFKSGLQPFSIEVNGKTVNYSDCNATTCVGEPLTVKVNYIKSKPTEVNYKVRIVSRAETERDFNITVDGEVIKYSSITADMTDGFVISSVNNSTFTVTPKGNLTEVLSAVLGAELNDVDSLAYENMFALVIETYDGEKSATIWFSILLPVERVELPERVEF